MWIMEKPDHVVNKQKHRQKELMTMTLGIQTTHDCADSTTRQRLAILNDHHCRCVFVVNDVALLVINSLQVKSCFCCNEHSLADSCDPSAAVMQLTV